MSAEDKAVHFLASDGHAQWAIAATIDWNGRLRFEIQFEVGGGIEVEIRKDAGMVGEAH